MTLKIEYRDTAKLVPYAKNSRTHSTAQVTQIKNSIEKFGFNNPVLIDPSGVLIAGHGRVMAAKLMKLKQVPCIVLGHLTDAQRRAYVIADNKIALGSDWDANLLNEEINSLLDDNFQLEDIGLDDFVNSETMDFEPALDKSSDSQQSISGEAGKKDAINLNNSPKSKMTVPLVFNLSNAEHKDWKEYRKMFDSNEQALMSVVQND